MATLPYWNNDEVISSDKLNSMVQAIVNGDPLAVKVSNATKNDVNQIVSYLSSLYTTSKTNLNSATSTNDFDTAYTNMTALVSNKLGSYANDDTVDLYSTGIRASIITFLQAYDTMMSNDRLNNKNTDNTLSSRIDNETQARSDADTNINNSLNAIQANGGGRNLAVGTSDSWGTVPDVDQFNITTIATYPNAQAGDVFTVSVDTQSTKTLAWQIWQGSSQYMRETYVTGGDHWSIANGTTHSYTTFTWPSGATQYLIVQLICSMPDGSHDSYQYKKVMLEKGLVAHDWQPSPEDTNSAIENVNAKADANTATISKITRNGGGRNMLTGTSDFTGWTIPSKVSGTTDGLIYAHLYYNAPAVAPNLTLEESTTYTVSFDALGYKAGTTAIAIGYSEDSKGDIIASDYVNVALNALDGTSVRVSITFTTSSSFTKTNFNIGCGHLFSTGGSIYIRHVMLEKGTVAHDWSPNPDDIQSQLDNLNANKLSSADAKWDLVAINSKNAYNYASGSIITFPNNSSITLKNDRIIPHINLPVYLTDNLWNTDLNKLATSGEYDSAFIPSATMATLTNRPTNPDTNAPLTGDCFFTNHYAYSGTTVRAFQKLYSCDYNYVFIRSYNGSSVSWSNWSCLTPYA